MRVIRNFGAVAVFVAVMLSVTIGAMAAGEPKVIPVPQSQYDGHTEYELQGATATCALGGDVDQMDFSCSGTTEDSNGQGRGGAYLFIKSDICSDTGVLQFTMSTWDVITPSVFQTGGDPVNDVTTDTISAGDTICMHYGSGQIGTWARANGYCDFTIAKDWRDTDFRNWARTLVMNGDPFEFTMSDFNYIVGADSNCTPPTIQSMPFAPSCVLTATSTITGTDPPTDTTTITTTWTVSSNLVSNYSFETPSGNQPAEWQPVVDGAVSSVDPFYRNSVAYARSGYDSVFNSEEFDLYQQLGLRSAGTYLAGFYAKDGNNASITLNGTVVASASGVTSTYKLISGTDSTGGGGGWLSIAFDAGTTTYVDDVFLIPVDAEGDLNCDAAYYPPPEEDDEDCIVYPGSDSCIPVPVGAANDTCYYCSPPPSASYIYMSYWIAWLACVIRNLFVCNLRVWLMNIENMVYGVFQVLYAFLIYIPATWSTVTVWLSTTVQAGADWLVGEVVDAILDTLAGYDTTTDTTSLWDVLIALIGLLRDVLSTVSSLVLGIVDLLVGLVDGIRLALATPAYEFEFNSITEPNAGDLAASGANDSKTLYILLMGLQTIDSVLVAHADMATLITIALAGLALFVLLWTLQYWKRFVVF